MKFLTNSFAQHLRSSMCGFPVCFFCLSPLSGSSVSARKEWCSELLPTDIYIFKEIQWMTRLHLLTRRVGIDAAAAGLRGAAISDLGRAALNLDLSRTTYIREQFSTGLVLYYTLHATMLQFHMNRWYRPVGLWDLLARGLQCGLWKIFKSSFIFFTAKMEIMSLILEQIERVGNARFVLDEMWSTSERRRWSSSVLAHTRR